MYVPISSFRIVKVTKTKSICLNRFPGFHHPLLSGPLDPDPGRPVLDEVDADAGLEVVLSRNLSGFGLNERSAHRQVLRVLRASLKQTK